MKLKDVIFVVVFLVFCIVLVYVPTEFKGNIHNQSIHAKAKVLSVDDDDLQILSAVKVGTQRLHARLLDGPHKGMELDAINQLQGNLELDEIYRAKENVLLEYRYKGDDTIAYTRGHYRLELELILAGLFAVFLIAVAGITGFKALLSFAFAGLAIWKIMIPLFLRGADPYWVSIFIIGALTASVSFLVGGLNRKGLVCFIGAFTGLLFASFLSFVFSKGFMVHGAVRPFAQPLLYAGFGHLDLTRIFVSGIIIACSGAVMDLAMDISAAMHEIREKKPGIKYAEHVMSGLRIGRPVIGTMTTTLLLAYSGGYTTMLMYHMGQGTPMTQFFNINYVAAEILNVFVGSFGLVAVAPFSAIAGGFIYHYDLRSKRGRDVENTSEPSESQNQQTVLSTQD